MIKGFFGGTDVVSASNWWLVALIALFEFMFVIYDILVSKSAILYLYRFRRKIKKYLQ